MTNPRPSYSLVAKLLIIVSALSHQVYADLPACIAKDNSPECTCYLISGPDPGYFLYHRFWDFRNISNDGDNDYTLPPPLVTSDEDQGDEGITSSFFSSSHWSDDFNIQAWTEEPGPAVPLRGVNSPQNVYISRNSSDNSTYLTLRANRLPEFASIAEIDSAENDILHASLRARLRVLPLFLNGTVAPGACFGLFTYTSSISESDIEILSRDPPNYIHYSTQPSYIAATNSTVPGATTFVAFDDGQVWTDWLDHRLDWTGTMSRWWAGGNLLVNSSVNVPQEPGMAILNLWSDDGTWSGTMEVGDAVTVGVEWIELLYNVSSDDTQSAGCSVGCRVDDVRKVGFPEVVFGNESALTCSQAGRVASVDLRAYLGLLVGFILVVGRQTFGI